MINKPVPKKVKIKKKTLFGYIICRYDSKRHICSYYTITNTYTRSCVWGLNIKEAIIYTTVKEVNEVIHKYKNKYQQQHFIVKCEYISRKQSYTNTLAKVIVKQTRIHPFQHIQLLVNKI